MSTTIEIHYLGGESRRVMASCGAEEAKEITSKIGESVITRINTSAGASTAVGGRASITIPTVGGQVVIVPDHVLWIEVIG